MFIIRNPNRHASFDLVLADERELRDDLTLRFDTNYNIKKQPGLGGTSGYTDVHQCGRYDFREELRHQTLAYTFPSPARIPGRHADN